MFPLLFTITMLNYTSEQNTTIGPHTGQLSAENTRRLVIETKFFFRINSHTTSETDLKTTLFTSSLTPHGRLTLVRCLALSSSLRFYILSRNRNDTAVYVRFGQVFEKLSERFRVLTDGRPVGYVIYGKQFENYSTLTGYRNFNDPSGFDAFISRAHNNPACTRTENEFYANAYNRATTLDVRYLCAL